ncbi:MAG: flagellar basal body P-ring formation chaperone FlgA [Candidatus Gastranaerophilales bacterium]|nr:flagellar basal body P-ring formation chaperone FlgA [Candidatus Gastranaerophilales bacterium]
MTKTVVRIALIIFCSVIFTSSSFAAVLTQGQLASIVEKQVVNQLSGKVQGNLEAKALLLPFNQFDIPNGKLSVHVSLDNYEFAPKKYAQITIKVNGQKVRSFPTPIALTLYQDVWVATENIPRNSTLKSTEFVSERKNVTQNYALVITSDKNIADYISVRDIKSGNIIDKRFVMPKPDVSKNSVISLIFDTGGINIAIDAESLQNGCIGDTVRVRSDEYRKFYTGKVIGINKVLVQI